MKTQERTQLEQLYGLIEDPALFLNWLQSRPAEAIAGTSFLLTGCPISTFLRQQLNLPIFVSYSSIQIQGPNSRRAILPSWTIKFVEAIDESTDYNPSPVTAAEAIATLTRIMADLN